MKQLLITLGFGVFVAVVIVANMRHEGKSLERDLNSAASELQSKLDGLNADIKREQQLRAKAELSQGPEVSPYSKSTYEATLECSLCEASFRAGVTACWLRNAGLLVPPPSVTNMGQLQDFLWHEQTNGLANIK